MASCIGIFYLVRTGKQKHSTTPSSPAYQYRPSTEPKKQPRRWFGLGKKKRTLDKETSGGWVQTGSGDEWDGADSGDDSSRPHPHQQHLRPDSAVSFPYTATPFIPVHQQSDSTSSIRFDMRQTAKYPSIQSRLSTPISTPPAPLSPTRESPEPMERYDQPEDSASEKRRNTTATESSQRTFLGGTKFVEQL